ncbi:RNA-guided endonuclease InsQ/TnpB family protein [Paenibacillus sedimenti]|uniref:IS200/IS605 family element transposase accessory protein TnpB n=1 Tax=Paenibacillus sedimenti TaxID=2770274 RepID=A0A926KM94_9BACL|nr:RNA-guided endonuclease TnpB family protein [Paenibacillus sedimenti]MBD0378734.1 IS200/IS605 family element transposase accessory protein TnpB [Paenibacillus sedimenti]
MKFFGVQKEKLRELTQKEFTALRTLFRLSKNMFNVGLYTVRQHFFETEQYLPYKENYHHCKWNENYKLMGSAAAQQTLKKVDEAFKSFFGLLKTPGQAPRIPKYLDKESFFELSFPQFRMQKDGTFDLPMSPAFKREFGKVTIPFPKNLRPESVCEIRLIPKYDARYIEIEYVYEIEAQKYELNPDHALAIDLGIDNLAACITTLGTSFIIDGKRLKSYNQWYNKENARLQSIKDKQGIKELTYNQVQLVVKRNNRSRDYLNKAARYIVDYCLSNQIGKIVVGHNEGWKHECDMGRLNNQTFVQIPHSQLIKTIKNLCTRYGIEFVKQEEAYTSKASFIDHDLIQNMQTYSGKRIKRGLYQTLQGLFVNADVNAAANILRKSNHKAYQGEVARGILTFPSRIQLV